MKYEKPKYLAGSTNVTPQNCGMSTEKLKSNQATPVTFTKVAARQEKPCVYNPKRRTLEEIENDIAAVEARIAKGIDIGPEWNQLINRYNCLQVEYDRVSAANNEVSDKKKYLAAQCEKTRRK
ncbi:hypothetical protein IR083_09970 [Dysgonomonas sp. GY75]|uniref:hypothetical protein n=1 Tax=Dysgonomonas sp. GY75 TaxID=2780419 RepID=UPI00188459DD|nr:hypothetical protein [Dysgonomonas sp. GY75]MBF0649146.1 hypothetical protein [Dysgonomonas sp. GY75]